MTQPGTYVGQDGQTYRWVKLKDGRYYHEMCRGVPKGPNPDCFAAEDWPAAKAALDALVEQEREEWVEWRSGEPGALIYQRCRPDGSNMQYSAFPNHPHLWHDEDNVGSGITDAYRKGRSVALSESEAIRDAARKLVEAVFAENRSYHEFDHAYMKIRIDVWEELAIAAQKLSTLLEADR